LHGRYESPIVRFAQYDMIHGILVDFTPFFHLMNLLDCVNLNAAKRLRFAIDPDQKLILICRRKVGDQGRIEIVKPVIQPSDKRERMDHQSSHASPFMRALKKLKDIEDMLGCAGIEYNMEGAIHGQWFV
jgi:hypothetical protein